MDSPLHWFFVFCFFPTALKINGQVYAGKNVSEGPKEAVWAHAAELESHGFPEKIHNLTVHL